MRVYYVHDVLVLTHHYLRLWLIPSSLTEPHLSQVRTAQKDTKSFHELPSLISYRNPIKNFQEFFVKWWNGISPFICQTWIKSIEDSACNRMLVSLYVRRVEMEMSYECAYQYTEGSIGSRKEVNGLQS